MKNIRSVFFSVFCLLLLSACGFHPMHGKYAMKNDQTVQDALSTVSIENIPDREGQFLKNQLIDRFYQNGRPAIPSYKLFIDPIRETRTDLDITKNSDATRAQLRLNSRLVLQDTKTSKVVLSRKLTTITSYNILQSQFTTRVSEQNARENALTDLASQIERQLTLYFDRTPTTTAPTY